MANDEPASDLVDPPGWVLVFGALLGAATLLFLMILVIAGVLGYDVPADARYLVNAILALGSAMSAGFLGGAAAIRGKIPIPAITNNPTKFSAAGGIAVLLIVFIFGNAVYVQREKKLNYVIVPVPVQVPDEYTVANLSPDRIADFGKLHTHGKKRFLYVEFRRDEENGTIRLSFVKIPGPDLETSEFQVDRSGTITPNDD